MDLQQQVKNSMSTQKMMSAKTKVQAMAGKATNMTFSEHRSNLQALTNGLDVPYPATLRVVTHDGDRAPMQEEQQTRKHPGYIRNDFGGFFVS
mmetsp:Transcript_25478/g.87285  ORF Transcript_25478/g.87285 Transcript_25478/m.87285 type:complete len:93 (-) Transcript_25478:209-487(-)